MSFMGRGENLTKTRCQLVGENSHWGNVSSYGGEERLLTKTRCRLMGEIGEFTLGQDVILWGR